MKIGDKVRCLTWAAPAEGIIVCEYLGMFKIKITNGVEPKPSFKVNDDVYVYQTKSLLEVISNDDSTGRTDTGVDNKRKTRRT